MTVTQNNKQIFIFMYQTVNKPMHGHCHVMDLLYSKYVYVYHQLVASCGIAPWIHVLNLDGGGVVITPWVCKY